MDPIYPWLDPNEVRRLADHLLKPHRESVLPVEDVGFDKGFVGYESSPSPAPSTPLPPPPQAEVAPPAAPQQTHVDPPPAPPEDHVAPESVSPQAPVTPAPAPPPAIPASQDDPALPSGSFPDRVALFRDWMHQQFSASGIFILDQAGAVIFDESHHGRLHFLARSLALAPRRAGPSASNVHVKIGATSTLEVIPVETVDGCLVLGAVVPNSLDPQAVTAIAKALMTVGSPEVRG